MKVTELVSEIQEVRWNNPASNWALVPTMGYLHDGHLSLIRQALKENDKVGVSIFVNPLQFNNAWDLEHYPHDLEHDLQMLEEIGVDLVWTPTPSSVYPNGFQTYVDVKELTLPLEGKTRPGHFQGVATVVAKLFNIFQPQHAYFGQKDAQQVAVIKRMVEDLNFFTKIVTCPIVRESDGLAMSSRNTNLSVEGRKAATVLSRALFAAKKEFDQGKTGVEHLKNEMLAILNSEAGAKVDYVSVAQPSTLEEIDEITEGALLSMAVFVEEVRLIDNIILG